MENQNQYQTNKCVYCSRTYKKKENYSKHVITCAFFHNVHLQSRDDFNLSVEDLPSQREMFLLMKELANKCHELEKKVGHLEQTVNIRQKKQIITWLNTHRTTNITPNSEGDLQSPSELVLQRLSAPLPLYEWAQSLKISDNILDTVFKKDLTEGIKEVISDNMGEHKKSRPLIPLASFTQKANTLYVYNEQENQIVWTTSTNENVEKIVFIISQAILRKFVIWMEENEAAISQSEERKDEEIMYMIKVNGSSVSDEKRASEIKKWLITTLEEDLNLFEFV